MKGHEVPSTDESSLLRAQIEQCYGQLPIALVANILNGAILTAVLWATIQTLVLLSWFALLVAVSLARLRTLQAFRAAPRDGTFDPNRWKGPFRVGAFGAGLVWGLAGIVLFHPESFPHQVLLAFLLGGMVAGAIPLLSAVKHAYPLFAIPVALASITRMIMVGDTIHLTMGLTMGIFSLAMLASSAQVRRIFRESESLRRRLSLSIEESQVLEELIRRDVLTGIPNRRLFEEQLQKEWRRAERDGLPLAIISADIDHFKKYNDRYGHQAGDQCLIKVAQAMQHALSRPGDTVARIGGEEFAFLLPGTTPSGAQSVAEQIRRGISGLNLPHEGSPVAPVVTVSMGIASSGSASISSPDALLHASDVALYEAKRRGRNQSVVIDQ